MTDWKYTYKRRGWNLQAVYNGLQERTWECFQKWHSDRGISCPDKALFDELNKPAIAKPEKKTTKPPAKKTTTRKTTTRKTTRKRTQTKGTASEDRQKK